MRKQDGSSGKEDGRGEGLHGKFHDAEDDLWRALEEAVRGSRATARSSSETGVM